MYNAIFCDKKNNVTHLWDTDIGYKSFPTISHAYRRKIGGEYKSLYGDDLEKIETFNENDPELFESDLQPELRALLELYPGKDEPSVNKVLVIDIETDSEGGFPNIDEGDKKITAIAFYDKTGDRYYSMVLDPESKITPNETGSVVTWSFKDEEKLLESFLTKWDEIRPTIVTGWNTSRFDLPYLFNRIRGVLGKESGYKLSSIGIVYQNKFNKKMTIAGISSMDYLELYKKFRGEMKPSYSLANVAKEEELKVQKLVYKGGKNCRYCQYAKNGKCNQIDDII